MIELNSLVLQEFAKRGMNISEGVLSMTRTYFPEGCTIEALGQSAADVRSICH